MDIIGKILDFNKQIQEGQGLKILTPDRMLSKLPISLAQLKAGNDSEKQKKRNKAAIVFFASLKTFNQNNLWISDQYHSKHENNLHEHWK